MMNRTHMPSVSRMAETFLAPLSRLQADEMTVCGAIANTICALAARGLL